jgi:hypothetical protein
MFTHNSATASNTAGLGDKPKAEVVMGESVHRFSNHQSPTRIFRIKTFCIAVLLSILLTPSVPILPGLPAIRLDDLLLILSPLYVLIVSGRVILDMRIFVLGLVTINITFATLWGTVLGFNAAIGDLFFTVRIAKYIGASVLGLALLDILGTQDHALRWFLKMFVMIGAGLGLIVVQQYFDVFELNASYVKFVAPTQYETLVDGYPWPRPVGMVGNPNEVGFLLGLLGLSSIWLFLMEKRRSYGWGVAGLLYLALMLSTMSRSSTASIFFGLALMLLICALTRTGISYRVAGPSYRRFKALAIVFLSCLALQAAVLATNLEDAILWRFSEAYVVKAAETRWSNWSENIDLIKESPIVGVGTLKRSGQFEHAADNEWLLLVRIGGLGLPLLVASLFLIGSFKRKSLLIRQIHPFIFAISSAAFIYMIPAALFFSIVVMPLVLQILTIGAPRPITRITVNG